LKIYLAQNKEEISNAEQEKRKVEVCQIEYVYCKKNEVKCRTKVFDPGPF
jgi:hypothetical protein